MKEILNHLTAYKSLDRDLAKEVLINLAKGHYNHSQIAAFLTVFTMRSVKVEELAGFKDAMLELCIQVPLTEYDVVDLCGTGGDSKDSFNISTLSSFVVAGAGQNVAKQNLQLSIGQNGAEIAKALIGLHITHTHLAFLEG